MLSFVANKQQVKQNQFQNNINGIITLFENSSCQLIKVYLMANSYLDDYLLFSDVGWSLDD